LFHHLWEKYDPEYSESVKIGLAGMNGNISNTYTIVPQFQGKYPIPRVKFSFFNPRLNKYSTIFSDEEIVDVYDGPIVSNDNGNVAVEDNKISSNSLQFNFIELNSEFDNISKSDRILDKYITYIIILPIVLIMCVFIY